MKPPTRSAAPPSTAPRPVLPNHPWGEVRLVLTVLFGLLGMALFRVAILSESETATFTTFLTGQIGLEGAFTSLLFWKMLIGFGCGATAGYFVSLEIPRAHLPQANRVARVAGIALLTLVVYIPAMSAGYLWDDDQEITANPSLKTPYGLWEIWTGGITNTEGAQASDPFWVKGARPPLRWVESHIWGDAFHAHQSADYFPLTSTAFWLEYQMWGLNPHGYHVTNILVHTLDVLLLWLVLSQLRVPGAWLGSLLFAIHPVHVESVAWISEHKNTLSLLFYLLSLSAYLRFEEKEKRSQYIWALLWFLAALLCKTSVVILPAVLLLCAWWRRGTLTRRDWLRSAPFFAIAGLLAWVTVWFQNGRAIGQEVIPIADFWSRLAGAGLAVWWYLAKAILPIDLITIYPRWPINPPQPLQFVAGGLVVVLFVLLAVFVRISTGDKRLARTPFFVFAYFVGTLFPVLGFFKMSYMRLTLVADHFQYLSDLAIVAVMGALIVKAWEKSDARWRPAVVGACLLLVFSFSAYSWERAGVHQSEKTLWTATLKRNSESWQAHNHYGAVLYGEAHNRYGAVIYPKKMDEALEHFQRAVDLKPDNPEVHNNLGLGFAFFGRMDEAIAQYKEAVRIKGDVPPMRRNLADALSMMGHFDEAAEQYRILLQGDPNDPGVHAAYGYMLYQRHRLVEAQQEFETVLKISPNYPQIRENLEKLKRMIAGERR